MALPEIPDKLKALEKSRARYITAMITAKVLNYS
jgi:hypothetical protein